jgi:hypothetical protein
MATAERAAREGTMYRHRTYQQVVYGRYNDFLKGVQDLNAVSRKKGWPESTVWSPVFGTSNEVVLEEPYQDLATVEKVAQAFQSDAEAMKIFRGLAGLIVQGSARDELLHEETKPLA